MDQSNKIEILDEASFLSEEEVTSYMDFDSLWGEYESTKATVFQIFIGAFDSIDRQVIKRTLKITSVILLLGVLLIKGDTAIKEKVETKTIEAPKIQKADHVKINDDTNSEEEIAFLY